MSLLRTLCARYKYGGLEPEQDLNVFEPMPYLRRQIEKQRDALISGICIGVYGMSFFLTLLSNHSIGGMKQAGHTVGMLFMMGSLCAYLGINMHRFRWLPVAIVGVGLLILGEFG